MRVTAKSDYALRALVELAVARDDHTGDDPRGTPVSAEELGRLQGIPHGFLQAILSDLRRAGLVASRRGKSGGWTLARDAREITVADVLRAVDGPLVSVHDVRPESVSYNERAAGLQHVWIASRAALRRVMDAVTIADLAAGRLPDEVHELTLDGDAWEPR
ncbi:Rrf2 family transcriptional regulator [uncultured Dietzia sp.]|jgi:Rrf2 family protein|uniref:RrF2 family transcriptional regulator n=1 Tax=uncultured Dietzia sp. TaxID=395519 RepID=UPI002612790B|nr:Rrf2 family transcriptional regulator [uncultured Dietzia sp.]HMT51214.1 Rrf2 family transcriptional regulator [Dietzia sp.]